MRWIVPLSIVVVMCSGLMACGGPQVPTHNGYKPKEAKPWKKPKVLKFDDKQEAKAEGDVSYPDMRRARWFQVELPANGQLTLTLESVIPGDTLNDEFDLGMEVFDPSLRVISKSDLEDSDAHELNKKKTLVDLAPGKYLIHLYLQGRMDIADFALKAAFKSTAAAQAKSNFPADVLFVPALAMVPITDDTPRTYKPTPPPSPKGNKKHAPKEPTPKVEPATASITVQILGVQVVNGGTLLTLGCGTSTGAHDGMKATITGISGAVTIGHCTERICTATVSATPDQLKRANGTVTLSP